MRIDRRWERLLAHLNAWADAHEVPDGIEVSFTSSGARSRTVRVVITPRDWNDYYGTIFGADSPAGAYLRGALMDTPPDHGFLVYDGCYDWAASQTATLPDPLDDFEPEPGGRWVALDAEGNVTSRYADWIEPDPTPAARALTDRNRRSVDPRT